ncbi:MAG: DNA-directed RNA polymerase subunit D [Desulfurococcales archaeon]|nr:DNA-directed RNA polymerase subunit D [Desulfurococcales archaeon]
MRNVKLLESSSNRIALAVEGFPLELVNSIRRAILSEVPVMAIEWVYITRNDSALFNEMLSHKLGLLVIKSDKAVEKYLPPEECRADLECGEDMACVDAFITRKPECFVRMVLRKENPADGEDALVTVKASDIESEDPDVYPVHGGTELTILASGQSLDVEMYARLGRGKEHAKFIPAVVVLKYTPVIKYDTKSISEECLECIRNYNSDLAETISKGSKSRIVWYDTGNTSLLKHCAERVCQTGLKVEYDKNRLILVVESHGALDPRKIISLAVDELDKKVKMLQEKLGGVVA